MTCDKCDECGLVLDNHDYDMARNCSVGLMPSHYELMMKVLRERSNKKMTCDCDIECIEDSFRVYCIYGDKCKCYETDCDLHEDDKK